MYTGGMGTPVPGCFPGLWSQVLSWGEVPLPQPGGGGVPQSPLGVLATRQAYEPLVITQVPGRGGGGLTPRYLPTLPPPPPRRPRTCYTAGGMPLAFTEEDFLVMVNRSKNWRNRVIKNDWEYKGISFEKVIILC